MENFFINNLFLLKLDCAFMFLGKVMQQWVLHEVCHEAGKGTTTIYNSTGIIFSMDVQNSRNQLLIESQNHSAWKRPLQ